ncbi:hypothetical protein [Dactylosporangium matsuzakiense]|uniref:Thioesterase family protein n=1 Tax=Dactylosporangium matsuzakiense TaxID=53360 RepID=A0A9W6KLA8_9ACTN|nr:hypothetical protein [Dactylosporangium matsuzakiense]UWZ47597.1 hypothetical protein Dmats_15015 [Dactylosporangium matsuzakiense]GLL01569.1 hypothetical protein GCM10017581_033110 [Dactylosporangium matsuzakiense]
MRIAARYNGPPGSGNGGYSAGLLAVTLGLAPAEVTLRRPPPLETDLTLTAGSCSAGAELIAEAVLTQDQRPDVVRPVPPDEAAEATKRYAGLSGHPFPTCYVCGVDRTDGLGLRPGPVSGGRTATPWLVPPDVDEVTMWAALDCPGGWSVIAEGRPYVLGRLSAWIDAVAEPGSTCVVMGQYLGGEGRKAYALSTVYDEAGAPLAVARATWIALSP